MCSHPNMSYVFHRFSYTFFCKICGQSVELSRDESHSLGLPTTTKGFASYWDRGVDPWPKSPHLLLKGRETAHIKHRHPAAWEWRHNRLPPLPPGWTQDDLARWQRHLNTN